ncbi:protein transport protein S31 [Coemansia sp. BCRC 34301]|nr:protein transport protein S31 [Coemansia sp. BCRC 34301]
MVYQFIERTAIPAWGPQQGTPLLAAGTVAGAMDASFSNTSSLEIFRLSDSDNDNENCSGALQAIGKVEANARFQRLAWSGKSSGLDSSLGNLGVLAGGLENGDITVWDAGKIISGEQLSSVLHSSSAHTGAVGGLEFNPFAGNLMASGAGNGEVFIWDIVSEFKSYSPGPRSQRLENVTDLSWNKQVQHILATASSSGSLVVWDLRSRREVIALNSVGAIGNSLSKGAGVAATEWNPQSATQLVTASADDSNPVIMLWDLRNANAPSQTFAGHQRGILSLSWCRKDAGLLLSSGKDNRTLCWNPSSGEIVGELPPSSNWVYDVQWNQANPNVLSGASFDGRINLYTLTRDQEVSGALPMADDPFAPQSSSAFAPSLSLKRPPRWLARPCGAAFGFGGQLVHFASAGGSPLVSISGFVTEPQLVQQAQQLESLLQTDQAAELCAERAAAAQSGSADQERAWKVLQILFESDARDKLVRFLGFDKDAVKARIDELIKDKRAKESRESSQPVTEAEEEDAGTDNPFASSASLEGDDDFFSKPIDAPAAETSASSSADIQALRAAFSGAFRIYDKAKDIGAEDADGLITRAVLLGDIEAAVALCIEQEQFADALILATCGSAELAARVQQAYFAKRAQQAGYVRLVHAIVTGDLTDVVANAGVGEWDEVLALLCTYAQGDQFGTLCEALGRRLLDARDEGSAVLCYLASGSLDHVTAIWIAHQNRDSGGAARTESLHALVEKVAVFRKAVQFVDPAIQDSSVGGRFVLAPLYDCYVEYAGFLAEQGLFDIAAGYLDRIPSAYRCVLPTGEDALAVLRNRLALTAEVPWNVVQIGPAPQPVQQQPIQQPVQAYGGYSQTYPAASTNMPAATHYSGQSMSATPAYPGGFAGMSQQQQPMQPMQPYGVGVFHPPPPMPVNPATIPTGLTPPPRRDDVPWNDPPPMLAKPAKRASQAATHAKPAAIVSPFPQGRDTPPPPPPHLQQHQPPQAAAPPRGGFVPSAAQTGKPLPPPPPPPPSQAQPMHPGMNQNMHPGMSQPMQPGFVPQPMQHQQQQMMPAMSSMQQQPPQSMRGQVVASAAAVAGPAIRGGTPVSAPARDPAASATSPKAGAPKYPPGDRSHLPDAWKPIVSGLSAHLSRAKQFAAPAQKRMVEDAERRLNALFDLMNCDEVKMRDRLAPVFDQLVQAVNARHFPAALSLQAEIMALNPEITTNVVGVKHLVNVLKTLPM